MKTARPIKNKKYGVYEHLEHYVRNTTYAQRLRMLEEMNKFAQKFSTKNDVGVHKKSI